MPGILERLKRDLMEVSAVVSQDGLGLEYQVCAFVSLSERISDLLATSVAMTALHLYKTLTPRDGALMWKMIESAIPARKRRSDDTDFSPLLEVKMVLGSSYRHPYDCPYNLTLEPLSETTAQRDQTGRALVHYLEDYYFFVKSQVSFDPVAHKYLDQAMRRINEVYAMMLDGKPPPHPDKPEFERDERLLSVEGELVVLWGRSLSQPPSPDPTLADLLADLGPDDAAQDREA
jgi:hypothetical protein